MNSLQITKQKSVRTAKGAEFTDFSQFTPMQKFNILESLQDSLDLEELMQNFAAQVNSQVNISACRLSADDINTEVSLFEGQRYYRSFNVTHQQKIIGRLTFMRDTPFERTEINQLRQFTQLLQSPLKHSLQLTRLQRRVRNDYLTGIGNRAHFDESLTTAIEQHTRYSENEGLVLVMLDLNKFKQVNDTYGHPAGDKVLIEFADILSQVIRKGDQAFRVGGDEFAMLLTPASDTSVTKIEARMKRAVAENEILAKFDVSASIGYSKWQTGGNIKGLIKQADKHLYQNKLASRG